MGGLVLVGRFRSDDGRCDEGVRRPLGGDALSLGEEAADDGMLLFEVRRMKRAFMSCCTKGCRLILGAWLGDPPNSPSGPHMDITRCICGLSLKDE